MVRTKLNAYMSNLIDICLVLLYMSYGNNMAFLNVPVNIYCAGSSQSGKTTFTVKLINEVKYLFKENIEEILYCTNNGHSIRNILPKSVKIYQGVPNSSYFSDRKPRLVILDDMLCEIDKNLINFFLRYSHHLNFAIIFLSQNLFSQIRGNRDISLNCQIIIIFKNPRATDQITHLAKQIYSKNVKFIQEAYTDATKKPYGYLFCDLRQTTPEHLRFRTNIFKNDIPKDIIYVPNDIEISEEEINNIDI